MKLRKVMVAVAAVALTVGMASCNDDTAKGSENDAKMMEIATQFVDHTVIPTYSSLAKASQELVEALETLQSSRTDANAKAAAEVFLEARAYWEKSEAFLFGAASDFGIDPHIDSWPLDEDRFNYLMASDSMMNILSGEDADVAAGESLGATLLGFHGIEYILFEEGQPKSASKISDKEMIYAVAVAGDLRNCCYQLEVSWAGDKAPKDHIELLEDLEWNYTVGGGNFSYGENMKNAGKAGSVYLNPTNALVSIVQGSIDIADEVGTSKIGKPHTGTSDEDIHYIESPYSWNSITDFANNIRSIQNVYMGGIEGQRENSKSLYAFLQETNPDLASRVRLAIEKAIDEIAGEANGMKFPFVNNRTDASAGEAMDACAEVSSILEEVITAIESL
ncbi:MAG: peptidase M75 [Bacteroidaceae bacterium]|nr:peptidase M75 [Bacteroidaceae bacterium]